MQNKRLIIALAGAVVFGLIATFSVMRYLSQAQAYQKNLTDVVVALDPIPLGAKITREQLTVTQMPNGSRPEGSFDSVDKIVGRVAVTSVGRREPITESKLGAEGIAGGLTAVIPDGFRAMAVRVDEVVGISGFVQPGSVVDVVVVINPLDPSQGPISKIVLQGIKVLASGQKVDQPQDGREAHPASAVTLQVTPDDAEKLALATTEGRLQLVMRGYSDQEDAHTRGASKRTLLTGESLNMPMGAAPKFQPTAPAQTAAVDTSAPRQTRPRVIYSPEVVQSAAPAAAPPAPRLPPARSVELIEGTKKRSVDFPN